MNTVLYCLKQGFSNLRKNILFSSASAATIAACIFLFCLFYSIVMNVQHIAWQAETTIGITVFFHEDATMEEKEAFRKAVEENGGVKEIIYTSADEAWAKFKEDYFGDREAELAEAFADDNPLAQSDSYEIFLDNIEDQEAEVAFIRTFDIVREVNYANTVVSALRSMNRVISAVSLAIIAILFAISVFLISNTITLAAHFRKRENEIMKLIGATNAMIRAPFVVEGTVLGLIGAAIPLILIRLIYSRAEAYVAEKISASGSLSALSGVAELLPLREVYPTMLAAGLILGAGMGMVVSFVTIRRHLKV
ncbi:MAG: permease-like cell division protein FtsX [Lachnospiraceae bacterium]|nr:permease-like cell division protein FtsX [Lachnospiraceae bacterium]